MNAYFRLMRFDKPIGIYLLLWPTLWGLFLAKRGFPDIDLLIIFTLGVILMRSAGCVINDFADRKIDKFVMRTKDRPLTSGEISEKGALILFSFLILMSFGLVLMTNFLTVQLSIAAVFLATLYPFVKRWSNLPQFVLGSAFAMSIPMAFSATLGFVPSNAWWIFLASILWTIVYDTIYAMSDRDDDIKIGVKSTAILFGKYDRLIIGLFQVLFTATLFVIADSFQLGLFFKISIFLSVLIMIYHQYLIKDREKSTCFKVFLNNHIIGAILLIGVIIDLYTLF
ncbi:MAG: 4-hydroxybenzoate octaprenyltransferase [Gammaproteobacteria bacterium]|nr:4-hydroxybenzoate octaprenyltransferase [Gammaproteobacteria bacterium]